MKSISELQLGFEDAKMYSKKDNKTLFNAIFVKNRFLEEIMLNEKYFLLGDKGTGKTAYAVYMENNSETRRNLTYRCSLKYIQETDYERFISLVKQDYIIFSSYTDIWTVILLMLACQQVEYNSGQKRASELNTIRKVLKEYDNSSLNPEIKITLNTMLDRKVFASLANNLLSLGCKFKKEETKDKTLIPLKILEAKMKSALNIKLNSNFIIFIDGIDIRPTHVDYEDYIKCIQGLAYAVWDLNTNTFGNVKDSVGTFKFMLLLRPDIFNEINFHNSTSKIRDNGVFLDWRTDYNTYKDSDLFKLCEKLLSYEQEQGSEFGSCWDYYFPWRQQSTNIEKREYDGSFIDLLRLSYSRPRDMIALLKFMKSAYEKDTKRTGVFQQEYLSQNDFLNSLSEYLLGSIYDYMSFYFSRKEFDVFKTFFNYLHGKGSFTYAEFHEAYNNYLDYLTSPDTDTTPLYMETPLQLLNFLYISNVIAYIEDIDNHKYWRWCYKERSITNPNPKVTIGENITYYIHDGLRKALNLKKGY